MLPMNSRGISIQLSWRILSLAVVIGAVIALAASARSQSAAPKTDVRLMKAVNMVVAQGHDAILPPHISNLLGIAPTETQVPVKQFVTMGDLVRGFEVSQAKHNDIVIFVEDRSKNESTFYLISPSSRLRKVLSVRAGVGYDRKPTVADQEAFAKEKKLWLDQLVPEKPAAH